MQTRTTANPISLTSLAAAQRSERIALERDVVLRIPDLPDHLLGSSANISATGMFVRSQDLQPAGRTLSFELSLNRSRQLIHGLGEVVWSRRFNLGADLPAGMGIRFLRLEGKSRRIVRSILDDRPPTPVAGAEWSTPLSGLTNSQQEKLHSYAGCAVAKPERKWPRRLQGMLSLAVRAARRVVRPVSAQAQ